MHMKIRLLTIAGIVQVLLLACGPTDPQLAIKKIGLAEELLVKGDTANAMLHLDSIPYLYPKAAAEAKSALQISNGIYVTRLISRRENLYKAKVRIDSLLKDFKPEKGEFDKYTLYIHNRQGIDKSWARSFVQVYFNEKGDLFLASNYYGGKWINHTSLSVGFEGIMARTDSVPSDQLNNHHSEFGGSKWEKVTYKGDSADKVIALIASNTDKKLKAVFQGKPSYALILEDADKKAIATAYDVAKALKIKTNSEKEIASLQKMIKPEE